jgi:hypothetical protein
MHMDTIDWILAVAFVAVLATAFGLALPPYGWLLGAGLAVYLLYRANLRRERLRQGHQEAEESQATNEPPQEKNP